MAKETAVELERFRIPCSAVKRLGIIADESLGASPNRLIGYTDYIDVFRSLVPLAAFDDSGEVRENTASADDAGDDMFGFMDEPDPDDYIHIYQIDLRAFAAFTERACQNR